MAVGASFVVSTSPFRWSLSTILDSVGTSGNKACTYGRTVLHWDYVHGRLEGDCDTCLSHPLHTAEKQRGRGENDRTCGKLIGCDVEILGDSGLRAAVGGNFVGR